MFQVKSLSKDLYVKKTLASLKTWGQPVGLGTPGEDHEK